MAKHFFNEENKMLTLNWIFNNNNVWSKTFDNVENAIKYVEICGMYSHYAIDKVWIDTDNEKIWLKEKINK